jgi:hypothetical protein
MRIVSRQDFLLMPAGTVFMKFPVQPTDGSVKLGNKEMISIKEETVGEDFVVQDLFPFFEGIEDDVEWADTMVAMLKGEPSPPVDYDCAGRDGLFDKEQLFLVWDKIDLERMIERLKAALVSGYKET